MSSEGDLPVLFCCSDAIEPVANTDPPYTAAVDLRLSTFLGAIKKRRVISPPPSNNAGFQKTIGAAPYAVRLSSPRTTINTFHCEHLTSFIVPTTDKDPSFLEYTRSEDTASAELFRNRMGRSVACMLLECRNCGNTWDCGIHLKKTEPAEELTAPTYLHFYQDLDRKFSTVGSIRVRRVLREGHQPDPAVQAGYNLLHGNSKSETMEIDGGSLKNWNISHILDLEDDG